jgi:hypothetical protein
LRLSYLTCVGVCNFDTNLPPPPYCSQSECWFTSFFQNHLKNVLQTLIAHVSTWQTRTGRQFQHSFGNSSSGCGLTRSHVASQAYCVPECRYEGDRREAVSAMLAAQSTLSADEGRPISLFHFRDALTVSHLLILQDNN